MNRSIKRLIVILSLAVTLFLGVAVSSRVQSSSQTDPVNAVLENARAAGSYSFDSDIGKVTTPGATVTNAGRRSRTETLYLEGQADLRNNAMEVQFWSDGGSALVDESGIGLKVENGINYIRQGTGAWEESETTIDGIAPQGDVMSYLHAVRDVMAHEPETRAGIPLTRYSFAIDGPVFARQVRDQLDSALRVRGGLPPAITIGLPEYYRDMTGDGELWVSDQGLPLRQILNLRFPEQHDEKASTQIAVDYYHFGQVAMAGEGVGETRCSDLSMRLRGALKPDFCERMGIVF